MLVIELARTTALVCCKTIMSTAMLSLFQTAQAAGATGCSTEYDMTLQLLCQLIEPPEKRLDVWVLCKPGSILVQPCPDLSNPCIGNRKKILIKVSKEFPLRGLESIATAFPFRSQQGETGFGCYRRFSVRKIEADL